MTQLTKEWLIVSDGTGQHFLGKYTGPDELSADGFHIEEVWQLLTLTHQVTDRATGMPAGISRNTIVMPVEPASGPLKRMWVNPATAFLPEACGLQEELEKLLASASEAIKSARENEAVMRAQKQGIHLASGLPRSRQ